MQEINLTYYGVIYSKKNSKRIVTNWRTRRPIIVSNRNAKNQESAMGWEFRDQAKREGWPALNKSKKDLANCQFYIDIAVYQKDLRRRDLDNQATAILDGLVVAGVIPDDSCDAVPKLAVEYKGVDRENPRAEIKIKEILWQA